MITQSGPKEKRPFALALRPPVNKSRQISFQCKPFSAAPLPCFGPRAPLIPCRWQSGPAKYAPPLPYKHQKYFLPKRILTPKPAFATISHVDWMRLYQQRPVDNIAEWCNGSTYDSDSYCLGSNPSSAAISLHGQAVKTSPSHGENWGSSPHGGATSIHRQQSSGWIFLCLARAFSPPSCPPAPFSRRIAGG